MKKLLAVDKKILITMALLIGIFLSVGITKAMGYSNSSEFCSSCHIMTDVNQSFMNSAHATIECGDCHLPHDNVVTKYAYKAKSGLGHIYYNTLGTKDIPQVIHASESTKELMDANCISCHKPVVENVKHDAKDSCVSCHRAVPHGTDFKTEDFNQKPKPGQLLKDKGGVY